VPPDARQGIPDRLAHGRVPQVAGKHRRAFAEHAALLDPLDDGAHVLGPQHLTLPGTVAGVVGKSTVLTSQTSRPSRWSGNTADRLPTYP
jgi:hypothetical protein